MTKFVPGQTFWNKRGPKEPPHLWVVIVGGSRADEVLVLVNFTDANGSDSDPTVLLKAGDHPFITKATCVNFKDAISPTVSQLSEAVSRGLSHEREKLDGDTLLYIQQEFVEHPGIGDPLKLAVRRMLDSIDGRDGKSSN